MSINPLTALTTATIIAAQQPFDSGASSSSMNVAESQAGPSTIGSQSITKQVREMPPLCFNSILNGIVNEYYGGDQSKLEDFVGFWPSRAVSQVKDQEQSEAFGTMSADDTVKLTMLAFKKVLGEKRFNEEFDPSNPSKRSYQAKFLGLVKMYGRALDEQLRPNRLILWKALPGGAADAYFHAHPEHGDWTGTKLREVFNQWLNLDDISRELFQVTELYLSVRGMTLLPPEIGKLTELQILTLEENDLRELPPEIGELAKLRELHLRDNKLSRLPKEIEGLTCLETLHLERNELRELPKEVGKLTELRRLDLQGNNLRELPWQLVEREKASGLWIDDPFLEKQNTVLAASSNSEQTSG